MGDIACVVMRSRQGASDAVPCVERIATIAQRIDVGYRCTLVDIALFTRLAHNLSLSGNSRVLLNGIVILHRGRR